MTPLQLQKDLCEEIEYIVKDMLFKDVSGKLSPMKAYPQELPKREQVVKAGNIMAEEEEDGKDPFPFCVVQLENGKLETAQSAHEVSTLLVFGIYDDDMERQGHTAILNIFDRVMERFTKNPVLKERYRMNYEAGINWILDDEDRYPYYFGALEMVWDTFFVRREDRYA